MRYQGKLTDWRDDKGFGFITPNGGDPRVFVHIKSFSNRQQRPADNEIVTYELKHDAKGQPQAESVAFVSKRATPSSPFGQSNIPLILTAIFVVFVAGSVFTGRLPIAVTGFYLVASLVTFIAYAHDKSAARNDQWRTPESTLHCLALIGGWPGALAAQRLLRHKSRKQSFQFAFWITVMLNCCAFAWLYSNSGARMMNSILGTT